MAIPLLETKLYAPRLRRGMVPRPRLSSRLGLTAESKLTLIAAPAGFGKTTLLAEWLAGAPAGRQSTAWLSLDEVDNEPGLFWTYLISAVQTVAPGVGASALASLEGPQPSPIDLVLAPFLNELSSMPGDLVLVLDDYHLVDSLEIQEGMTYLLEHLPPRVHLVLTTRADPALPLARLRARGELVEVRAADLRFTLEEATAYLDGAMGLNLSETDVAALEGRTEGWIAALQLAALSMQGREDLAGFIAGFAGDDRYIVDYLVEDVLRRQPEDVRAFLLQTAILDRLCGGLTLGGRVTGVVTGVVNFGAFVELSAGVDGLIHYTELPQPVEPGAGDDGVRSQVAEGSSVVARVLAIDAEKRRVSLTLRDPHPWLDGIGLPPVGARLSGTVTKVAGDGIRVVVLDRLLGVMGWPDSVDLDGAPAVGSTLEVVVVGLDSEQRKLILEVAQTDAGE